MTDDELHQLAGAYALDALDADERTAFEAHLPHCATCSTTVAEFELTVGELGEVAHIQPPSALRDRIMAEVANTPQVSAPVVAATVSAETPVVAIDELAQRRRPPVRILAFAAAAALVLVGAVAALSVAGNDDSGDLIAAPDAVTLQLDPTGDAPADATIEVVWSAEQDRALVRASGLPDPGEGKVYELWFLVDDGVAPAGLFSPTNGEAEITLDLDDIDGLGWGVTIEPETGSDQPTSDVLFAGVA